MCVCVSVVLAVFPVLYLKRSAPPLFVSAVCKKMLTAVTVVRDTLLKLVVLVYTAHAEMVDYAYTVIIYPSAHCKGKPAKANHSLFIANNYIPYDNNI